MNDDIKLNGQCVHGYPADGTCPYCHPAEELPVKPTRYDTKKAATEGELLALPDIVLAAKAIIEVYREDCEIYDVARAYLALREQVEPAKEALDYVAAEMGGNKSLSKVTRRLVDAAIKAIEEGKG